MYFEPFCGGGHVLQEMSDPRIASDGCGALITMYRALQAGWVPPRSITEEEYAVYKRTKDPNDPATAFVAFACSFGGKWFGGYARQKGYNFAVGGGNALKKQLPRIAGVNFEFGLYDDHHPHGMLIYCDPPYAGTTQYGAFSGFDHPLFWETMRVWAKHNTVVVSEFSAPEDFACALEIPAKTILRDGGNFPVKTCERLFMLRGCEPRNP